jgi:hypothetical protein
MSNRGRLFDVLAAALMAVGASQAIAADELRAEYAIQFSPASGVPATPEEVLNVLGHQQGKAAKFKVQYFDVDPQGAPAAGFSAVLRERVGKKTEVTWKYLGSEAPSSADRDTWRCPLRSERKLKDKLDVSLVAAATAKRAYSRSCTSELDLAKALPPEFKVTKRGCKGDVSLLESKDGSIGVERWTLKSGAVFLEVSWKGDATSAAQEASYAVLAKLVAKGVQPLDCSMTDIASGC